MSLLTEIEKAATTSTEPLPDLLRRCKVLAARLKHAEFATWVSHELNGYADGIDLPPYRIVRTPVSLGTFVGSFGRQMKNVPLPIMNLPQNVQDVLTKTHFRDGVASLHEAARNTTEGLGRQWSPDLATIFGDRFFEDFRLMSAHVVLTPGTIAGILDTVRTRVLDFVLAIQAEDPDAGESRPSAEPPIPPKHLKQIFYNTIIGGNANIGTSGEAMIENSTATGTITLDGARRAELSDAVARARKDVDKLPKAKRARVVRTLDAVEKATKSKPKAAASLTPKTVTAWANALTAAVTAATVAAPDLQSLQQLLTDILASAGSVVGP